MQKGSQTYHWEEYNKQNDIGLITIYQHQQRKQSLSQNSTSTLPIPNHINLVQSNNVETQIIAKEDNKRYLSSFRQRNMPVQTTVCQSQKRRTVSEVKRTVYHKVQQPQQEKKSVKIGYYDVTQMSNLLSFRTNKDLPFLQRINKQKRSLTIPSNISQIQLKNTKNQYKKSFKIKISPIKCNLNANQLKEEKVKILKAVLQQKERNKKNNINRVKQSKPINFIQYKLGKLKEKRKQFTKLFVRSNKHSLASVETEKDNSKQGIKKAVLRIRVSSHSGFIHDYKLREIIQMYFTPISTQKATTNQSHSL